MKSSRAIFTSCNLAYLDRALTLLRSLRTHEPNAIVVLVVVDEGPNVTPYQEALDQFDLVIEARHLGIPEFRSWIFGHDVVEACTAVKGAALVRLLREHESVIYLDPDTYLYSPLDQAWELLAESGVVLTPHLAAPEVMRIGVVENEMSALLHGTYNLGFVGVSGNDEGFAPWWRSRTISDCIDAPERGLFTDQRWVDLVPGLFGSVQVLRHPGYNLASWNLNTRRVHIGARGALMVDGKELVFMHYTKAMTDGPTSTSRSVGANALVGSLWRDYCRVLAEVRADLPETRPWCYGEFSDGLSIPREIRRMYRSDPHLRRANPDPFVQGEVLRQAWARRG